MNKKYTASIVVVILAIIAWLIFGSSSKGSTNIFVKPQTGSFQVNIVTNGELRAQNSVKINAPSEAMRKADIYRVSIQKLVPEGTVVQKGDFVAQLDLSDVSSALTEANNELRKRKTSLKQAKLDSAQTLSEARNNITNLEYGVKQAKIAVKQSRYESPATQQKVKFDLQKAKRELANAKKGYKMTVAGQQTKIVNLQRKVQREQEKIANIKKLKKRFTILAPQNGMIIYQRRGFSGSKVTEGDQVSAGRRSVVAKLPDFSVMQSVTYVNEVDIQEVKLGEKVDISLDAYPDKHLTGAVTKIANIGEQRPGSSAKVFRVLIQIDQSMPKLLRPAMTTRNIIHVNYVDSAMHIPLGTIHIYHDSLNVVYKHHSGKPVMQQVVLGLMNDNNAIVKAGLGPKDQLYLSMPSDTSGIKKEFLSDKVIQKYKARKQKQEGPSQVDHQPKKMMHKRGQINRKKMQETKKKPSNKSTKKSGN